MSLLQTKGENMKNTLSRRLRFWLDPDSSLLNVMVIDERTVQNNCAFTPSFINESNVQESESVVKTTRMLEKPEEVFDFIFPYLYELARAEAEGTSFNSAGNALYQEAVSFKNSVESWLRNQVAWGYLTHTEARIILSGLYLPTTRFASP